MILAPRLDRDVDLHGAKGSICSFPVMIDAQHTAAEVTNGREDLCQLARFVSDCDPK